MRHPQYQRIKKPKEPTHYKDKKEKDLRGKLFGLAIVLWLVSLLFYYCFSNA